MKLSPFLALGALFAAAISSSAQTLYIWNGSTDNNYTTAANWNGGVVPPSNGTAALRFTLANYPEIVLQSGPIGFTSFAVQVFDSFSQPTYNFGSAAPATLTLQNGLTKVDSAGSPVTYNATVVFGSNLAINLSGDQTWTVGTTVRGSIGGLGRLTFAPSGNDASRTLSLYGPGNFTAGVSATGAIVELHHSSALSGGALSFTNSDLLLHVPTSLTNNISLGGNFRVRQPSDATPSLVLNGTVTLNGAVAFTTEVPTTITGRINESSVGSSLFLEGRVRIEGDNSTGAYTGGTSVMPNSVVTFLTANSLPTTGTVSGANTAYAGTMFNTNVQTSFLGKMNAGAFFGTLGFDSPNPAAPLTYAEALDLSAFTSFRGIGSSSIATLSGPITIAAGTNYLFGGGGGTLFVNSALSSAGAGLSINSPSPMTAGVPPLAVVLRGTNTFGGGIGVNNGVLVFDGAAALPAGNTITFNPANELGYVGATEAVGVTPAQFLARFDSTKLIGNNVVGFDSTNIASPRTITDAIDLSLGGTVSSEYYLGTSTRVTLSGSITPTNSSHLRLTGVRGGHLTINSALPPTVGAVFVGVPGSDGIVQLNGSGLQTETHLDSGTLILGHARALGTGPLHITGENVSLGAATNLRIQNDVVSSMAPFLTISNPTSSANLNFAGFFQSGFVHYRGAGTLTFSGRYWIPMLNVEAAGSGGVVLAGVPFNFGSFFGYGDEIFAPSIVMTSGSLTFQSRRAAARGIMGGPGTQVIVSNGTTLRLHGAPGDGPIDMAYGGTITGAGKIEFVDDVKYTLSGANTYTGGSVLRGGAVLELRNSTALGTGLLSVMDDGGELLSGIANLTFANGIFVGTGLGESGGEFWLTGPENFALSGIVSGPGVVFKDGASTVRLTGANTVAGFELNEGGLQFENNSVAGTRGLYMDPYSSTQVQATFTTSAPTLYRLEGESSSGGSRLSVLQLAANSNLTIDQTELTDFHGQITGSNATLTKSGLGELVLRSPTPNPNTYSGGTVVNAGALVFGTSNALPTTGNVRVNANGYVGLAATDMTVTTFLNRFDRANTTGTIGFDNHLTESPFEVANISGTANNIDLTGFSSGARLGTASHAIIRNSVTITPSGTDYRFGGGGGHLQVDSLLSGARGLVVDSPTTAPLTLRLTNVGNSFTGPVTVQNSALIFATPLPSGTLTLGTGGYIGTEDTGLDANGAAVSTYLGRFGVATTGVIGFDTPQPATATRTISAPIDMSNFTSGAYLGTATPSANDEGLFAPAVRFSGTLTPAGNTHRFAGFNGGALEVASLLSGSVNVVIGQPNVPATFGNRPLESYSTVMLSGANTFTGNVTLHGGALVLGHATALGSSSNSLLVQATTIPAGMFGPEAPLPQLESQIFGLVVPNSINLASSLSLGGNQPFELTGNITGAGGLHVDMGSYADRVTLSGSGNTFTGGVVIESGEVNFNHNLAAGSGLLTLRSEDAYALFLTPAPVINGLRSISEGPYDLPTVTVGINSVLTIDQSVDTTYRGYFQGYDGGGQIRKTGTGTLRLEGDGYYLTGVNIGGQPVSFDIQQGAVVVGPSSDYVLGSAAVRLAGGTLALDNSTVDNPLILNSGTLAGRGAFETTATIATGVFLSPGSQLASFEPVGHLTFDGLIFAGGGTYNWNLQASASGALTGDMISTGALSITSTAGTPFTVRLTSLLPDGSNGSLALLAGQPYSWTLVQSSSITGLDASNVVIDSSQFLTNLGPGSFTLAVSPSDSLFFSSALTLNFVPVPEPSTWAMMFLGTGALALAAWRRRRRG